MSPRREKATLTHRCIRPTNWQKSAHLKASLQFETLDSSLDLPNVSMTNLNFPDGEVLGGKRIFFDKLTSLIQPADILITPFAYDGHPDHEGTGQVVQRFCP